MANASLEDCQLFAQSEILQRDLFIAAKQQEDHPKKREDCVQHEAESVSASSLKINRFRNRWNSGEAQARSTLPWPEPASFKSPNHHLGPIWRVIGNGYMLLVVESIPGIPVLRRFI